MILHARPPRARSIAITSPPSGVGAIAVALSLLSSCYSGNEPGEPWRPGADDGTDDGDDDGDDDGADDAADDAADDDAADDDDGVDDGGSADDGTDGGDESSDGASLDGGSADDDGATTDDGADSAADDGGASEVPDNDYCMAYADWDDGWSALEQDILDIVNQRRSEGANCGSEGNFAPAGPLAMNPALRCAARKHSQQMVESGFFDHTTPWGEGPGDRIGGAGYNGFTWGENIAGGNSTAAATMDQWMESDGHCANIMNPDFEDIGVGYFPGGEWSHYWTQAFGAGG